MKIITDINASNILLEQYTDATAQLWLFDVSLKRLSLKLSRSKEDEVIYIIAVACEHITGPFSWHNAHITISRHVDSETAEPITKIADEAAGFQLIASGGFALAQGHDTAFGPSFDNFLR